MYVLDIITGEIKEYCSQPEYVDITTSPFGDILVTDGYGIEMFTNSKIKDMENVLLTPHAAWGSYESRCRCISIIADNIRAFYDEKTLNRVDI